MTIPPEQPLLLDTNIVSFLLKRNDTHAPIYRTDLEGKILAISFVTVGELYRWPRYRTHSMARRLEDSLSRFVILPSNDMVSREWARIKSIPGLVVADNDAWIAACTFAYACTLVHHDKVFRRIPDLPQITHLED